MRHTNTGERNETSLAWFPDMLVKLLITVQDVNVLCSHQ